MKKFTLLAVVLMSVFSLVACSSNEETSTETSSDEIVVWCWDPAFNVKAMEIAEEYYYAAGGEKDIVIVEMTQEDIYQKMHTSLSSGSTEGLPNIVLMDDGQSETFLATYPDAFVELPAEFNPADFAQYKLTATQYDGKNYGVPFDTGVTCMYVRTDYLAEAGYTVDDMQNITWEQFIEIGIDVKEATGKPMLALDPDDLGIIRIMMQSAGYGYLNEEGMPYIDGNPAMVEAFETYKAIVDAGISTPVGDWAQLVGTINSGDVACVIAGSWMTPSIKQAEDQAGKWAVCPTPKMSDMESVNASNLGGSSWYVLNVPGSEDAIEFLMMTFGSNVEFYNELAENGIIGTYLPAQDQPAYNAPDEFFGGQSVNALLMDWMAQVPPVDMGQHTYQVEDILVIAMQEYMAGEELDQVLKEAQELADQQIK